MNRIILVFLMISTLIYGSETGVASYYTVKSNRGIVTASGHNLKDHEMTAAHKSLPFGTLAKITNLDNNKSVVVKITDRGPYVKGRIIDGTRAVAESLGFKQKGLAKVKIEVVKKGIQKKDIEKAIKK